MPPERDSLLDMLESARRVLHYLSTHTRQSFETSLETRDAVVMRFGVIGEAARRLSEEFREANPGIPWHEVINMRHVMVHRCDSLDFDIIWDTATTDLPPLIAEVEKMLAPPPAD